MSDAASRSSTANQLLIQRGFETADTKLLLRRARAAGRLANQVIEPFWDTDARTKAGANFRPGLRVLAIDLSDAARWFDDELGVIIDG